MIRGCDISLYQGNSDFNRVKSQVDFVICKASEGVGYLDPTFANNQKNIRNAGLLCGFYHFARPDLGNSAIGEANWFLSVIGEIKEGEILVLDYEVNFSNPVGWCKDFLAEVYNKTGCRPLIYLNLNLVKTNNWTPVINENYGLWLADYDGISDNTPDTPWPTVAMKQWSSTGQVAGIIGDVDVNTFFGDANAFKAYGYHAIITQSPPQTFQQTDQTIIDLGQYGKMEVQAIRGKMGDLETANKQIESLTAEVDRLNKLLANPPTVTYNHTSVLTPIPPIPPVSVPDDPIATQTFQLPPFLQNLINKFTKWFNKRL